jgi:hypothetical protein
MWVPFTDAVVVVTCNPTGTGKAPPEAYAQFDGAAAVSSAARLAPLRQLLRSTDCDLDIGEVSHVYIYTVSCKSSSSSIA